MSIRSHILTHALVCMNLLIGVSCAYAVDYYYWNVPAGDFASPDSWDNPDRFAKADAVPRITAADVSFLVTQSVDCAVVKPQLNFVIKNSGSIEFDGDGRRFALPALAEDQPARDTKPLTFTSSKSAENGKQMACVEIGSTAVREAMLSMSDAHFRFERSEDAKSSLVFNRGIYEFGSAAGHALRLLWDNQDALSDICFSNVHVTSYGVSCKGCPTNANWTVSGGTFAVNGDLDLGNYTGLSEHETLSASFTGGAQVLVAYPDGGENNSKVNVGHQNAERPVRMSVSGVGTKFRAGAASTMSVRGDTEVLVKDGAVAHLPRYLRIADATGPGLSVLRLQGDTTRILCNTNSGNGNKRGSFEIATAANSRGKLKVEEGWLGCSEKTAGTKLSMATGAGSHGELIVSGGTVEFVSGSENTIGNNGGEALVAVSNGTLRFARQVRLDNAELVQTGGEIKLAETVSSGVGIIAAYNDAARTTTVTLDGGVMTVPRLYALKSRAKGCAATANFSADGGTLAAADSIASTTDTFIDGFDAATLGALGLTVDTGDRNVTIGQPFADKDGAQGVLRKIGVGRLTVTSDSHQSYLDVEQGTVAFAVAAYSPVVRVGLSDKEGRMAVDGSRTVALGGVVLGEFSIEVTGAASVGTYPVFTVPGDQTTVTDVLRWKNGYVASGRVDGRCYGFTVTYDEPSDRTRLNLVVSEAYTPTPTVFDDDSPTTSVKIDGIETVEALVFKDGRDFTLSGGGAIVFADRGSASIRVESGSQTISVPVYLPAELAVYVAEGASLTISGKVNHAAIVKTGDGQLFLANPENNLTAGAKAAGGLISLPSAGAISSATGTHPGFELSSGTLEVGPSETVDVDPFEPLLNLAAANDADALVVKTEDGVDFGELTVTRGNLQKRGVGQMVVGHHTTSRSALWTFATGVSGSASTDPVVFPEGGASPTANYPALGVYEGELRLCGLDEGELPSRVYPNYSQYFGVNSRIQVGILTTASVSKQPSLVIDHAAFGGESAALHLGYNATKVSYPEVATNVSFVVTNKSVVYLNTMNVGAVYNQYQDVRSLAADVKVDDARLEINYSVELSSRTGVSSSWSLTNGSRLYASVYSYRSGGIGWSGDAEVVVDSGSVIAKDADLNPTHLDLGGANWRNRATGTMLVRNGGQLVCNAFNANWGVPADCGVTLAFDGGLWSLGSASGSCAFNHTSANAVTIEAREGGLVLDVPENVTWGLDHAVTGVGGLVKRGQGTFATSADNLLCTGSIGWNPAFWIFWTVPPSGSSSPGTARWRMQGCPRRSCPGRLTPTKRRHSAIARWRRR